MKGLVDSVRSGAEAAKHKSASLLSPVLERVAPATTTTRLVRIGSGSRAVTAAAAGRVSVVDSSAAVLSLHRGDVMSAVLLGAALMLRRCDLPHSNSEAEMWSANNNTAITVQLRHAYVAITALHWGNALRIEWSDDNNNNNNNSNAVNSNNECYRTYNQYLVIVPAASADALALWHQLLSVAVGGAVWDRAAALVLLPEDPIRWAAPVPGVIALRRNVLIDRGTTKVYRRPVDYVPANKKDKGVLTFIINAEGAAWLKGRISKAVELRDANTQALLVAAYEVTKELVRAYDVFVNEDIAARLCPWHATIERENGMVPIGKLSRSWIDFRAPETEFRVRRARGCIADAYDAKGHCEEFVSGNYWFEVDGASAARVSRSRIFTHYQEIELSADCKSSIDDALLVMLVAVTEKLQVEGPSLLTGATVVQKGASVVATSVRGGSALLSIAGVK